jgi:hypothetical protein
MLPASDMTITELNEAILTLVGVKRTFEALECVSSHRTDNVGRLFEWAGDQGELVGNEPHRLMITLDEAVPANDEEARRRAVALPAGADHVADTHGWRFTVSRGETDGLGDAWLNDRSRTSTIHGVRP